MRFNSPRTVWCYLLHQAELTLNLLCTAQTNPEMWAYEALEGKFDYNDTSLAPTGTKALIYEVPTRRTAWAPHAVDGWYLRPAMKHYRCGRYFIPTTRAIRIASSTKHFPTHCSVPTIAEHDRTLLAAADLIQVLEASLPLSTEEKIRHTKIIEQLTEILQDGPPPRVDEGPPPRVDNPSTSTDAKAPRVVQKATRIHQHQTRRNTPIEIIPEETQEEVQAECHPE